MAAAKTEAAPPPPKEAKDPKDAAPAAEAAPAKGAKPIAALLPVIAVVVLAPALSWTVGQFVLLPQLKKQIATAPAEEHAEPAAEAPAEGGHGGGHGKKGEAPAGSGNTYDFENMVVNLAGTMGTRYLKTTFQVSGKDKGLRAEFEANKPKLIDVTLNVLSSLSLTDLEEPGHKNIIREKLIVAYNQALGRRVAEQIYFSDFVIQ
jgi:flagellar protein FliL